MRKVLFATVTFLTIAFFIATPLVSAQKKKPARVYVSNIERQAEDQARFLWSSYIKRCGEDYYARDGEYFYHFKNSRITVSPNSLTKDDKLNQIGYAGHTYFKVGQTRIFSRYPTNYQNSGWGKWHEGFRTPRGSFSLTMSLHKVLGHWEAEPGSTSRLNNLQPVDCRDTYDYDDGFYERRDGADYRSDGYYRNNDDYREENSYNRNDGYNSNDNSYNRDDDNYNRNNNSDNRNDNSYNRQRRINWIPLSLGQSLPYNAITGGGELDRDSNGAPLNVCRAGYNGDWHPGKLLDGECRIGYRGREIIFSTYEVAVGGGSWRKANANYAGALIGGRENGRALYVCRADLREFRGSETINYGQYLGKVVDGRCHFAYGTKELSLRNFDVFYPNSYDNYSH